MSVQTIQVAHDLPIHSGLAIMYRPRWFSVQELVPHETYSARGDAALELLDERLLRTLDALRDEYGRIKINTWATGGDLKYRGFRPRDCNVGAEYSQHRYGRAADITPLDTPLEVVYEAIKDGLYDEITTVENLQFTPTWIHVDVRNHRQEAVRVVDP